MPKPKKCKTCNAMVTMGATYCSHCLEKLPCVKELKRIYREALYRREKERVRKDRDGVVTYWE